MGSGCPARVVVVVVVVVVVSSSRGRSIFQKYLELE